MHGYKTLTPLAGGRAFLASWWEFPNEAAWRRYRRVFSFFLLGKALANIYAFETKWR